MIWIYTCTLCIECCMPYPLAFLEHLQPSSHLVSYPCFKDLGCENKALTQASYELSWMKGSHFCLLNLYMWELRILPLLFLYLLPQNWQIWPISTSHDNIVKVGKISFLRRSVRVCWEVETKTRMRGVHLREYGCKIWGLSWSCSCY